MTITKQKTLLQRSSKKNPEVSKRPKTKISWRITLFLRALYRDHIYIFSKKIKVNCRT